MNLSSLFFKFLPVLLILGGLGLIFYTMGLAILSMVIETVIGRMMRLVPDTMVWDLWKDLPLPIYMKFSFFNVTNADQIQNGAKPILQELGPYVYLIDFEKVDFKHNEEKDTVKYRQIRTFYFQPDMSYGLESDNITIINVIYLGVTSIARQKMDVDVILEMMDDMIVATGEKLTKTTTVSEILFTGMDITNYLNLLNEEVVKAAVEEVGIKIPDRIADGKFGLLKGLNATDEGFLEVQRGIRDSSELAEIVAYNGMREMDVWLDSSCNALNGTDGTMNRPFMNQERRFEVFIPLICRSLHVDYDMEVYNSLIPCGRFIGFEKDFLGTGSNPDNWCFCPKEDPTECDTDGVFHVDLCLDGVPAIGSKPHFLGVRSSKIHSGVIGLNPDPKNHETFIDFYMLVGAPIEVRIRLQMNIELTQTFSMPTLSNVSDALVPFLWLELSVELDWFNKFLLLSLSFHLAVWKYFKWVMTVFGLLQILGGFALIKRKKDANKVVEININKVEEVKENPQDYTVEDQVQGQGKGKVTPTSTSIADLVGILMRKDNVNIPRAQTIIREKMFPVLPT